MKLKKKKVVSLKGLKPKNHKKMSPKAYEGRKKKRGLDQKMEEEPA